MNLKDLQKNWDKLGKNDPLWAILSYSNKKGNKWKLDEFFETGVKEIEKVLEYVESIGITIRYKKALDFGCGVGRLTQALPKYFDEVHGVDIARSMIELANNYNRYGNKCNYHLNEEDNLKLFSNDTFDFIYTNITLQHMKPKFAKNYIKEFLRILSSNGLLIFQIPSERKRTLKSLVIQCIPSGLYDIILKLMYINRPIIEMHYIKRENMIEFLKQNDAEILDIKEDQRAKKIINYHYFVRKRKKI